MQVKEILRQGCPSHSLMFLKNFRSFLHYSLFPLAISQTTHHISVVS
ncbi:hypothetical protein PU02_0263 [Bartonella ancashensis]|uniref:Uncharacterized protein n=1 Tax=Bartonella ancashensis TaxID=1318743 RepID=A0A0M4LIV1_9HYPH|nr:hypothetical protein PU02_0263 [Bartonella ancashensis]